jgi:hypothetical protein
MRILGLQIFPSARPSEECGHHQWETEPQTQVPNIIDFLSKTFLCTRNSSRCKILFFIKGTVWPDLIGPRMVPLEKPKLGQLFRFDIGLLNGVLNSIAFHAQLYLITNSFGGR